MSETKKLMPTVTNYLSDNDGNIEEDLQNTVTAPQVHTNYAEWKRLKKTSATFQNGIRSVNKPLADISSSEEDFKFDDNEPIFKIMNYLSDKDDFRRRNENLKRKIKKPSHFLLFSRMKQHIHFDCTFGDLCQITQASWENMETSENEELIGDIDRRIREYKEVMLKFRKLLLPETTATSKPNTCATATKSEIPTVTVDKQEDQEVILTLSVGDDCASPKIETIIPERLQNLAGDASVYNAPEKSKRINYHEFKSSRQRNLIVSDTIPNNVSALNSDQNCNFPDCENRPIEDHRWDGQYCSAKCLIKDCHAAFTGWLTERKQLLGNGDPLEGTDPDQEIVLCLESPSQGSDDSLKKPDNRSNFFEKPNKASYFNEIISGRNKSKLNRSLLRNISIKSDLVRPPKRHSLVNRSSKLGSPSPLDDFESFRDNQAHDFVT